jgi:nucleotide-binding universal stress UspA family protein
VVKALGRLRRLLTLGSTARLVIKMSKVPVIRVKALQEAGRIRLAAGPEIFNTILAAFDPAKSFDHFKSMVEYLSNLALRARSEVILLSVVDDREDRAKEVLNRVFEYLTTRGLKRVERMLVTGKPHNRIIEVADQINAGCIMVKRAAARGPGEIILGTTTSNVVSRAEKPVIVYP